MNEKQNRIVKKKRWVSNENISTNLEQKVEQDFSEKKMGVEGKVDQDLRKKKQKKKFLHPQFIADAIHKKWEDETRDKISSPKASNGQRFSSPALLFRCVHASL